MKRRDINNHPSRVSFIDTRSRRNTHPLPLMHILTRSFLLSGANDCAYMFLLPLHLSADGRRTVLAGSHISVPCTRHTGWAVIDVGFHSDRRFDQLHLGSLSHPDCLFTSPPPRSTFIPLHFHIYSDRTPFIELCIPAGADLADLSPPTHLPTSMARRRNTSQLPLSTTRDSSV